MKICIAFVSAVLCAIGAVACVGEDPGANANGGGDPGASDSSVVDGQGQPTSSSSGSTGKPSTTSGSSSTSSGSTSGGTPPPAPTLTPIAVVRNPSASGHPALGTSVTVSGIVTGVKTSGNTHGFFLQDKSVQAWAGIYVWVGSVAVDVTPGEVVTMTGTYTKYRGFEELQAPNGVPTKTGTTEALPAPIVVAPGDIAAGGQRVMELQSMRLRVLSVTTTTVPSTIDFNVRPTAATSGPELIVTSYMATDITPSQFGASAGQTWQSITGFGYYSGPTDTAALPKLAPLANSDLQ